MGNALRRRMISSNLERLIRSLPGLLLGLKDRMLAANGTLENIVEPKRHSTSSRADYRQEEQSNAQQSARDLSIRISRSRPVRISIAGRLPAQQGDSVYRGGARRIRPAWPSAARHRNARGAGVAPPAGFAQLR